MAAWRRHVAASQKNHLNQRMTAAKVWRGSVTKIGEMTSVA